MAREQLDVPLTIRESVEKLTVDELKALLALVHGQGISQVKGRKAELVAQLATILENPAEVRRLYEGLDNLGRSAIQEAVHDPHGICQHDRFAAKYGYFPLLSLSGSSDYRKKPTPLRLFFLGEALPTDMRTMLLTFVPPPPPLTVASRDELPATVKHPHIKRRRFDAELDLEEVELHVRETTRAALLDVKAILRLIDAGQVKVGEKTRRPSQATLKAVAAVLSEGDFYREEDRSDYENDPAIDLNIKAFAWPMLLQAAGLAGTIGSKLQLTPAGRKATTKPAHEAIRHAWVKWLKTPLLDEFNRIDAIKGQNAKNSLTAVIPRRQAVVEGLKDCTVGKWVRIEDLFQILKVEHPFLVARDTWTLYICEQPYGTFGYETGYDWECLQGRFVFAVLFEYAATLGLIDVAFIPPGEARDDFGDHWGADDFSCLSRYDGLMYFRINPLGAWCLGLADSYEPQTFAVDKVFKVLPNLDVVAADRSPSSADMLFLERFAERRSDSVWHIDKELILVAVEQGLAIAELREFVVARNQGPLPQTVEVFLDDMEAKVGQIEDLGAARLIACKDTFVAQILVADRKLRNIVQLAGERHLVFRASDEATVRKVLKDLGHVLPPPR